MDSTTLDDLERANHGGTTDPGLLDFSLAVNPRSPSGVAGVFESSLAAARAHPTDDHTEYRTAVAERVDCTPREVIPVPGVFAGTRLAANVAIDAGDRVLTPEPGCSEFPNEIRMQGAEPVFVPHGSFTAVDPVADDLDAVMLCNPNTALGSAFETDALYGLVERCQAADVPVVMDETFMPFADRASFAGLDGVVVIRSLGEVYGLPGLRMAYAVATGDLRDRLEVARTSWALSVPAAAVAEHCLAQDGFVAESRERLTAERERMAVRLSTRFGVHDSDGPFLLCDVDEGNVERVVEEAREAGIAIRDATNYRGLDQHVRLSVRREAANDRLLGALGV